MNNLVLWTDVKAAVYASSSMIESVKKAQQEASAALLSRALQMCRAKQVTHITFSHI